MILKLQNSVNKICRYGYCTKSTKKSKFSHTVLLPKTKFPLRLENKKLVERDDYINKVASSEKLYQWQKENLPEPKFILHDGPPYANGAPHLGHAINKILKDTILRYNIINGTKVHYIPGWDCHGLPIELKALTNTENLSAIEIREKAKKYATNTIEEQRKVFESWGILADWANSYKTYSVPYIENQFKQFLKLYKRNLVYRDIKPIYWSPSSRTALAEAELEYNEKHISLSTYVRFKIKDINVESLKQKNVYGLIWTTTPWTLVANQAVCYNPTLSYSFVRKPNETDIYIVATDLLEEVSKTLNSNFEILGLFSGKLLKDTTYFHPIMKDNICNFLSSSHATASKGTGLVHCAPAHGPEDFLVSLENQLNIVDLVNEQGCYKKEAGEALEGKFVLTEGSKAILEILKDNVMHLSDFVHSYPYDWRSKQPVIIRACQQWFIDCNAIRRMAVDLLHDVEVHPKNSSEVYKRNLINQIQKRPYWCISRQRMWGVPIPVLYDKHSKKTIINEDTINNYIKLLHQKGPDFWWNSTVEELLPENFQSKFDIKNITQGEDILDIWFDSGISWSYVLSGDEIADMYLEGVDQFTGWFQSSLITSVALREKAPYKSIYVHGFAVDENGVKMSKSLGNVIDPVEVVRGAKGKKPYGLDSLRWWVACHANEDSVAHVTSNVLQSSADEVQKIRSTLRFILGALSDYDPQTSLNYSDLFLIDKYILHLLTAFHKQINEAVKEYKFARVNKLVIHLLTNSISALYYTSIKDRLYCDEMDSITRRTAQFTLLKIFEIVSQAIAPIVPHLAEEMFLYLDLPTKTNESYFRTQFPKPETTWENDNVENIMDVILGVKKDLNKLVGAHTTDKIANITLSKETEKILQKYISLEKLQEEMIDILQVSEVNLIKCENLVEDYSVNVNKSKKHSCERCRKIQSEVENELCKRCYYIVDELNKRSVLN